MRIQVRGEGPKMTTTVAFERKRVINRGFSLLGRVGALLSQ